MLPGTLRVRLAVCASTVSGAYGDQSLALCQMSATLIIARFGCRSGAKLVCRRLLHRLVAWDMVDLEVRNIGVVLVC